MMNQCSLGQPLNCTTSPVVVFGSPLREKYYINNLKVMRGKDVLMYLEASLRGEGEVDAAGAEQEANLLAAGVAS